MQLLRCQNESCSKDSAGRNIFDFTAEDHQPPVCPTCGTDLRERPEIVIRRKLIHYDPPHLKIKGRGQGQSACGQGSWSEAGEHVGFTGDPGAVTCHLCRATEVWTANALEMRVVAKYDLPIEIDPEKQTIKPAPCAGCP